MLESVSAVPEGSGEPEESDRIDALLSSALADQARERRMLVETVFGAKTALLKAEEELAGIRELIDKRDEVLLEAIAKNNQQMLEAVGVIADKFEQSTPGGAGLTDRIEAIEEAIIQLAQRIAGLGDLPGQLRRDLEVSAVAIGDRIGEESASLLADLREDQVEVVQTLVSMSEAELKELKQAVNSAKQEIAERTTSTARDSIEAGRTTVEQMVEYLTGYLQERDEQLYRARDKRLIELFQQLSETIGRTTKRKLSKSIGDDYHPPQPLSSPTPPAPKPAPLNIPRTFRQPPPQPAVPESQDQGQSFQDLRPVKRVDRPDPAFAFNQAEEGDEPDEPPIRTFAPIDEPPDPFDSPQVRYRPSGGSFGVQGPASGETDPQLTQAMSNPLSRAELVRDYLADSPEEMFLQDLPAPSAPKNRRKPPRKDEMPPAPRSVDPPGRAPKPPAKPHNRRKP